MDDATIDAIVDAVVGRMKNRIGVNRAVERPVVVNGQVTVRLMMNLSSSFDHRFVDGYDAAAMIQRIKDLLEHPATIFLP